MAHITVTPAYGRDYKSKKAAVEDFDADKDFIVADVTSKWDGKLVNKSQLVEEKQYSEVNIRYKKLTMVAVVKLPEKVV